MLTVQLNNHEITSLDCNGDGLEFDFGNRMESFLSVCGFDFDFLEN